MQHTLVTKIINFVLFQLGWIIAVYYHSNVAALFCFSLALIAYILSGHLTVRYLLLGAGVALIGIFNDYILHALGIIKFPNQTYIFLPLWLCAVWFIFVATFGSSLAWLQSLSLRYKAILGGLGGAVSYIAGAQLGAVAIHGTPIMQFAILFVNWFFLFPFLLWLYCKNH